MCPCGKSGEAEIIASSCCSGETVADRPEKPANSKGVATVTSRIAGHKRLLLYLIVHADYTARMENFTAVRTAVLVAIVLAVQAFAQGTQAKQSASQYYAHGELDKGNSLGADFLGKFLPIRGSTIYSDEYVFVEVALFGPVHSKADIQSNQFSLKVNGHTLLPQPPGMVTLDGNFPEMVARPQVVLDGGAGSGEIEIGGRERKPRFPGDDTAHTPNSVPQIPADASDGQVPPKPQDTTSAVNASVLPEGKHSLPISGYLLFAFEGKLKKIKHAELEYKGPLGNATLTLR